MKVLSIVPRLYPAIDGVGDYALNLARQLRQDFAIDTHFIIADPTWTGEAVLEGFSISPISLRSAEALVSLLQTYQIIPTVLLHYVPHGYAKKACPFWLVKGLRHWRNNTKNAKLVTMFHELYAFGLPIINTGVQLERTGIRVVVNSDFWLAPVQKKLTAHLIQLSSECLTSRQGYAEIVSRLSKEQHQSISTLPIPSNIGELKEIRPLSKRHRQLVIMGQQRNRLRVYQKSQAELKQTCEALKIEKIVDIGPSIELEQHSLYGIPIVEMGRQPAAKISEILSNSIAGFLNYNPTFLAKSGIFAAYCSHGVLPINHRGNYFLNDGLMAVKQYWVPSHSPIALDPTEEFQAIANNAFKWYESHNLSAHAKVFAEKIAASMN